jgi:hypothetical protein
MSNERVRAQIKKIMDQPRRRENAARVAAAVNAAPRSQASSNNQPKAGSEKK